MPEHLLDQLEAELRSARQREKERADELASAKARHGEARAETRKLQRVIQMLSGGGGGVTCDVARPIVEELLRAGEQSEEDFAPALADRLRAAGKPISGLSFVLRPLRRNYFDAKNGVWRLPQDSGTAPGKVAR